VRSDSITWFIDVGVIVIGVRAGEPLRDGPSNPHDILNVLGEKGQQASLVNEVQGPTGWGA